MYLLAIIVLLGLAPIVSIGVEYAQTAGDVVDLAAKWFVFWAVGVRLFVAGARQVLQPAFTARDIFEIEDVKAHVIVRELGFANLSFGALGIATLWRPDWIPAAALAGGLFYGLAGVRHLLDKQRTGNGVIAMVSDLIVFAILAACLADWAHPAAP